MPSRAAAVAVATPCWPAPVSATSRVLPMRLASRAWPSTLLILWEPVWFRSSRFRRSRQPSSSHRRRHSVRIDGPPGVVPQQAVQLGPERGVGPGVGEGRLQLLAGRDQRLGHEPAAEPAEAAVGVRAWASARRHLLTSPSRLPSRRGARPLRSSYSSSGRGRPGGLDEGPHLGRVLAPGRGLDPAGHVDAPGAHRVDAVGHVLRGQAAGQDDLAGSGARRRPATSRTPGPTRARGVQEQRVGAVVVPVVQRRVPGREPLDDQAAPARAPARVSSAVSRPWSCAACSPQRLDDLDDLLRGLVPEHADGEDLGREPAGDVADLVRAPSAGARGRTRSRRRRRPWPRRAGRPPRS